LGREIFTPRLTHLAGIAKIHFLAYFLGLFVSASPAGFHIYVFCIFYVAKTNVQNCTRHEFSLHQRGTLLANRKTF